MARNGRFSDLETYGSQPGNQRLPLQGIAGSQKLEFMFSKLSGIHCKELREFMFCSTFVAYIRAVVKKCKLAKLQCCFACKA